MPGWLDPSATRVRLKEAQRRRRGRSEAAAQEEFERDLLHLRWEVKKLKLEHELWLFEQKYSPDQPRDEVGRWTSGAKRVGDAAAADNNVDLIRSSAMPVPIRSDLARNMRKMSRGAVRSICLKSGSLGGHAIEGHVGKEP